jgi:hypothetical protein
VLCSPIYSKEAIDDSWDLVFAAMQRSWLNSRGLSGLEGSRALEHGRAPGGEKSISVCSLLISNVKSSPSTSRDPDPLTSAYEVRDASVRGATVSVTSITVARRRHCGNRNAFSAKHCSAAFFLLQHPISVVHLNLNVWGNR